MKNSSLFAVAVAAAAFVNTAWAGETSWGVSVNIPVQSNYSSSSYSTTYGGLQAYRQVPQTVCRQQWNNGYPNQVCTTEYINVPDYGQVYVAPPVVYTPPPVIVQGNNWGYPAMRPYNPYRPYPYYGSYNGGHRGDSWRDRSGVNIHFQGR